MKILLIEDNRNVTNSLCQHLRAHYCVDVAHTGAEGKKLGRLNEYDVILLDLHLPDTGGLEVCTRIREKHPNVPVVILAITDCEIDKVLVFNGGADAYIVKPVGPAELLAHLRALMRRCSINQTHTTILQAGDLMLNIASHTVTFSGESISLRPREFNLLEYLMRNRGLVLTRGQILEHVWETDVDPFTNTVDVHIKYLRDKICRRFRAPLITTIPGLGYKLED